MSYSFNPFTAKLDKTSPLSADSVKDTHIDWGMGTSQVNSDDVPDHDGHTVKDTFNHILNRGKAEVITVTETGGLGISWTTGEIYDETTDAFIKTTAGSGNLTNTAVNYLKWVSGTGLTISTSDATGNEVLIATASVYDGNINGYREASLMSESTANARRGLRALFPIRIISGMSVHEDTDGTNPLDVTMDTGVFWKEAMEKKSPTEIKSRNTAMVRHFHTASVWDSDTNIQIETTNYDNGTQKTAIPANKYVKGLFIKMVGKIGFVYPTAYYTTIAQAQDAALPAMPTGLELLPKLTAVIYKQGVANFTNAVWQDVRAGISEESFNSVTDHGALAGLADDDHPQYVKDTEFTQNSGILVGTGAGTFAEETGATLRTSIGCAATAQAMHIGTTSVAINRASGALTLAGITLTTPDIGTPTAGTLTNCSFPTLNQSTTGTAANVSGTPALPDGTTATTQAPNNNSTKLATTAYADTAAAAGGATVALDNLAAVQINTSLVSDGDITDNLGTGDVRWKDTWFETISAGLTAADTLKLRGRDVDGTAYIDILTITSNNTVTADLNAITTIGGNAILYSGGDAGTPSALVGTNISGTASALNIGGTAAVATLLTITDNENTNEENPVVFVAGADPDGGNLGLETDGTCTYNPSTGVITTTGFAGALTGNADTVTTNANLTGIVTSAGNATAIANKAIAIAKLADGTDGQLITWGADAVITTVAVGTATHVLTSNGVGAAPTFQAVSATNITVADTVDTTCWVGLWQAQTGSQAPKSDGGMTYNAETGMLTVTGVTAPLIGNVTGDCSGSSGSCTGQAATVANATFTTALTVNTGTLTLTANIADNSVLTIGAGAVSVSGANTGDQDLSGKADVAQTMHIGTTSVAINRASAALTLAGLTLTTPDIGTPSAGTLTNCSFPTLNQNTTGSSGSCTGESATVATITTLAPDTATTQATQAAITTCAALTTVGILDAGSITANFGTINNGASAITTTGDITGGGIHATGDTAAGDNAALGYTATEGLIMTGQGSTNDLTFKNDADGEVMKVLTGTTTLTMVGAIQLGETSIKLDAALSADTKWSGITIAGTSGVTTLAIGDLIYLNANDSRWELVDANLSDGYDKQLGIALTAAGDGSALEVLVFGKVRSATFPAFTVGSPLYMSETAGDITHTCPTTADVCVRAIGIALSATDLLFNPSNDYLIHV